MHSLLPEAPCECTRDRSAWRNAIAAVFGPANRLHHYRDLRTRMLRGAFCTLDCRRKRLCSTDEPGNE